MPSNVKAEAFFSHKTSKGIKNTVYKVIEMASKQFLQHRDLKSFNEVSITAVNQFVKMVLESLEKMDVKALSEAAIKNAKYVVNMAPNDDFQKQINQGHFVMETIALHLAEKYYSQSQSGEAKPNNPDMLINKGFRLFAQNAVLANADKKNVNLVMVKEFMQWSQKYLDSDEKITIPNTQGETKSQTQKVDAIASVLNENEHLLFSETKKEGIFNYNGKYKIGEAKEKAKFDPEDVDTLKAKVDELQEELTMIPEGDEFQAKSDQLYQKLILTQQAIKDKESGQTGPTNPPENPDNGNIQDNQNDEDYQHGLKKTKIRFTLPKAKLSYTTQSFISSQTSLSMKHI